MRNAGAHSACPQVALLRSCMWTDVKTVSNKYFLATFSVVCIRILWNYGQIFYAFGCQGFLRGVGISQMKSKCTSNQYVKIYFWCAHISQHGGKMLAVRLRKVFTFVAVSWKHFWTTPDWDKMIYNQLNCENWSKWSQVLKNLLLIQE